MNAEYTDDELGQITAASTELIVAPFPSPGKRLGLAFKELNQATNGSKTEKEAVNKGEGLPRPWIPATCTVPKFREELFAWLDEVVMWLNQQYTWDTAPMIPQCWPLHPHVVNELAVLADLRRRAEDSTASEAIQKWHDEQLPGFFGRMRTKLGHSCDDGDHTPWPGNPRFRTYIAEPSRDQRMQRVTADARAQQRINAIVEQATIRTEGHEADSAEAAEESEQPEPEPEEPLRRRRRNPEIDWQE